MQGKTMAALRLLHHGANPTLRTVRGKTAADVIGESEHKNPSLLLREASERVAQRGVAFSPPFRE